MAKRRKPAARMGQEHRTAWVAVLGSLLASMYLVGILNVHGVIALALIAVGWATAGLIWAWVVSNDGRRDREMSEEAEALREAPRLERPEKTTAAKERDERDASRPLLGGEEASPDTHAEREVVTVVIGDEAVRAARIGWTKTRSKSDGRGLRLMDAPASAWIVEVAGLAHYRGRSAPAFAAERPVRLVPEPDNAYDPNAIAVMSANGRLKAGYLRADAAAWAADTMRATGTTFSGIVLWESRGARRRISRDRVELNILISTASIRTEPRVGLAGRAKGTALQFEEVERWGEWGTRWVSQARFAQCVEEAFPNHQVEPEASPEWLGGQRLDVFVEALGVAFEYQGQQHYEPVSIFGGDEGLAAHQQRDVRKREACRRAGVVLIEWKYDEPFSVADIRQRLSEHGLG